MEAAFRWTSASSQPSWPSTTNWMIFTRMPPCTMRTGLARPGEVCSDLAPKTLALRRSCSNLHQLCCLWCSLVLRPGTSRKICFPRNFVRCICSVAGHPHDWEPEEVTPALLFKARTDKACAGVGSFHSFCSCQFQVVLGILTSSTCHIMPAHLQSSCAKVWPISQEFLAMGCLKCLH